MTPCAFCRGVYTQGTRNTMSLSPLVPPMRTAVLLVLSLLSLAVFFCTFPTVAPVLGCMVAAPLLTLGSLGLTFVTFTAGMRRAFA